MEMGKRCDGFLFGDLVDLVCGSIWPDDVEKARTHIDVDVCVAKYSTELRLADIHRMRCARARVSRDS